MSDQDEVVNLIAKTFIQRRDVFARQYSDGSWRPVEQPFTRSAIVDHLCGHTSLGHYLLDSASVCKFFAFDIDLVKSGFWLDGWDTFIPRDDGVSAENPTIRELSPRTAWRDRAHPARSFMKMQFRMMAGLLAAEVQKSLEIPVAVSYSGFKGLHVYGLTGPIKAQDAREGAQIVLDSLGCFAPSRGKAFWAHQDQSPEGYPNLSIEVFPKQTEISEGGYGNLMSLPLGKNSHGDPRFFVDVRKPMSELVPQNPIQHLTQNIWAD